MPESESPSSRAMEFVAFLGPPHLVARNLLALMSEVRPD
jgi:hypothetical protein